MASKGMSEKSALDIIHTYTKCTHPWVHLVLHAFGIGQKYIVKMLVNGEWNRWYHFKRMVSFVKSKTKRHEGRENGRGWSLQDVDEAQHLCFQYQKDRIK